ncbi:MULTISPECIES: TetR/AcrR family transcriptional regulator [unclassified Algibacter]|uniref:TetR/AcrR family transcriptional regulator n=1 Tax=unclassified Algibacter TaxID=2615009 RepID=UPI00131AD341|nr:MULTISPECIES: TetR/AcrR family transcriptional regulator [unclassified Algibacter]MCL5127725.1 TetR/AcrR family transcriptional regulator [Algibacter sp. L4_22]
MNVLLPNIKIEMPPGIYLKDPETSPLGKKIIKNSIILIQDIGFEGFNFKKLGLQIDSNESSIYRYFESKHKLLIYLTSWYWSWIEYQLVLETHSINSNEEKLKKAIEIVTRTTKQDNNYSHIDEVLLNKIIINENSKSYLTKKVDTENKEGFFMPYRRVVYRISEIILVYNNTYTYSLSLASSILEGSLYQHFLKSHFKTITNCDTKNTPTDFFTNLVLKTIQING